MKANRLILLLPLAVFLMINMVGGPGCANIVPPAGGPRDSIPPLLLKAAPNDSTLQFTGNRVSFTFDDYVELQNQSEEVMMSPTPKTDPFVDYRLNTVTVRLKDTLEPNTTYTIDFGNAIKDINEGNVLKNFKYTFSTGNYIDSMELSGKIIRAETGKPDSTVVVLLHTTADDSIVTKQKPRYIARVDGNGNFRFTNLPPQTFYMYALQADNRSRLYLNEKDLFAFADSPVVASRSARPVTLYAYAAEKAGANAALTALNVGGNRPRGNNNQNAADRRLKITSSVAGGTQDLLGKFYLNLENPIKTYDSTKVGFFMDSVFTPVPKWRLTKDSGNRRLTMEVEWKENTEYHLVLDKEFLEDSTGKKLLRTDTLDFRTRKFSDYGEVKLRIRNLDFSKNPVLQFIQNDKVVDSYPLTDQNFAKKLFPPGDYDLRILYDTNKNGVWDPGDLFKRRQPELVKPIEQKISIKANWGNEFERTL
jgi:hypothetical protein